MPKFRYRTSALTGPWRETPEQALNDAVKAKQAWMDRENPSDVRWIVPGQIEEERAEGRFRSRA